MPESRRPLSVRVLAFAAGSRPGGASGGIADLLVLLAVVALPALGLLLGEHPDDADPRVALLGLAVAAPMVWLRRRWPVPILAVLVLIVAATLVATGSRTPLVIAVVVLVFTVATTAPRPVALIAGGATVLALYLTVAVSLPGTAFGAEGLAVLAWTGLALATGFAVRNRADYIAGVEERARRAEQSREEEARRRVAEERLRIARELHDVVAHQMTVIRVHSEVAAQFLTTDPVRKGQPADPARALEAVDQIRTSAGQVLHELASVLRVLRAADGEGAPIAPAPGLADLPGLVDSFSQLGTHVSAELPSGPFRAGESVQTAVFRIVQEALTNARRHGQGPVALMVRDDEDAATVLVENARPVQNERPVDDASAGQAEERHGLGLIGMRERVEALGGTLVVEQETGRFRVRARFPSPAAVPA